MFFVNCFAMQEHEVLGASSIYIEEPLSEDEMLTDEAARGCRGISFKKCCRSCLYHLSLLAQEIIDFCSNCCPRQDARRQYVLASSSDPVHEIRFDFKSSYQSESQDDNVVVDFSVYGKGSLDLDQVRSDKIEKGLLGVDFSDSSPDFCSDCSSSTSYKSCESCKSGR